MMISGRPRPDAGLTVVETMIAIAIFSLGTTVLLTGLDTATSHSGSSITKVLASDKTTAVLPRLEAILGDSAIRHIDTASRFRITAIGLNFQTDRFTDPMMGQCPSATCGFHTRDDLTLVEDHVICSREYRQGMGMNTVTRGKNWPSDLTNCPYDDNQLTVGATLDGVKLLVARTNGEFATRDGEPHWNTMLFIFPRSNADGFCDLTVTELRISDLLGMDVVAQNWTRWTDDDVSFVDLLDFGSDGTADGVPDGSAPVTAAESDAEFENFSLINNGGNPTVIFSKILGSNTLSVYRRAEINIDLNSGLMTFTFIHKDSATVRWESTGTVTRTPEVLTRHLTEFAVSTEGSSPRDEVTNQLGVGNSVVRVHLGLTSRRIVSGERHYEHQISSLTIRPKN